MVVGETAPGNQCCSNKFLKAKDFLTEICIVQKTTPEDIPAQAQSVNYLISDLTTSGYNMEEKIRKYRSLEILNDRTRTESISSGRNQPTAPSCINLRLGGKDTRHGKPSHECRWLHYM